MDGQGHNPKGISINDLPKILSLAEKKLQRKLESVDNLLTYQLYPRKKSVKQFYGDPVYDNFCNLRLPYPMKLAWDKNVKINRFKCNKKVRNPLKAIFRDTLQHYGYEKIKELGLDLFAGCVNIRMKRGSKTSMSMHAWGIAVDLDSERNKLSWGKDKAIFAKAAYDKFWQIVESYGATSLGRTYNYDYMHFEFVCPNNK